MANQYNLSDQDYAIYCAEYEQYLDGKMKSNSLMDSIREQNKIEQFKHDLRRQQALAKIQKMREAQRNETSN